LDWHKTTTYVYLKKSP